MKHLNNIEKTKKLQRIKTKLLSIFLFNPCLSTDELVRKSGASEYIVLREYTKLRRDYAR